METLAIYLLKSATWLTGFAVIYYLFLRDERYFMLKRIYLISGILISFIFPLISFHYQVMVPAPDFVPADLAGADLPAYAGQQQGVPEKPFDFRIILLFLYLAGVIFLALRMALHIRALLITINKGNINNHGPARLIRTTEFQTAFSFFNYIFINPSVNETETREIMNHELVHVRQKHWFDLLLVEILRLVQWANPFVWIYTGFIRLNHEYLADEAALQRTSDPAIYKAALVNQLLCAPVISLSNSFNYSRNKKRFDMMKKIIISPYRKMKIFLVLPVFAIIFYAFATPEYNYSAPSEKTVTITEAPAIIKDIKGVVLKEDGSPFARVPILVTGTAIRATTDESGNFTLAGVPQEAFIVFSYRGYLTQVLKAEFSKKMEVKLLKDPDYKEGRVISYRDDTQGFITVRPGNISSGPLPKPLVIVDGVIYDKGINGINPNEIKSVSILKDNSATAVFGEKGKNGVIVVTTKRGGIMKDTVIRDVDTVTGKKSKYIPPFVQPGQTSPQRAEPLVVVDDVISLKPRSEVFKEIGDQMASMKNLSAIDAIEKYGEKGINGALEIMTLKRAAELGIKIPFRRRKPDDFPTFQGNLRGYFSSWVTSQVKYPAEAATSGIQGIVRVRFTVEADGTVSNVKFDGTPKPLIGDAVLKVVQSSPKWEPAKNPEASGPYNSVISLKFELPDKVEINVEPFVVVEQMPEYPGGEEELLKFIAVNTQYPDSAKAKKIQGRVITRFIVNKEGKAEDVTVLKGVHPLLDAEAVRVVGLLSGFRPGYQGGIPVPVWYMLPVTFTLK